MGIPIIFNPQAGRKRAWQRLRRLQAQLKQDFDYLPTTQPGHATQLAVETANSGSPIIVAAGGDGTVHEVANGILQSPRRDVTLVVMPIGSANDYYHSLLLDRSNATTRAVDVGVIRAACGKERFFVCCLGIGLSGAVTRESRRIRGLQGLALYGLATLRALQKHFVSPPMHIAIDDNSIQHLPTLMLSVMVGKREGNFLMAPDAHMDDGWFDYVHAGNLSRGSVLALLPRLALWGTPKSYPGVTQGQCRMIQLSSDVPLTIHIDGEFFCLPEDNIAEIKIELLPKRLQVCTDLTKLKEAQL